MDEYQEKYEQLLEENKKLELEFGLARRRFKELYVGCENQLNNEKETSRQLEIKVKELTRQIDSFRSENEGIRIAAKLSEEAKQEEFANQNTQHEEEIASMKHIWKEASYDREHRLVKEFEEERKKLLDANAKLEQKIRQMEEASNQNRGSTNSDGIVSMMSNAFTSRKPPTKGLDLPAMTLENSQQQVQQDINAWKSVVEPLEMEIESLKKQLSGKVSQSNDVQSTKQLGSTGRKSDKEFMLSEELKEAQKDFESEKSARTDLEMYVAVLNTQKTVLQEDLDKLKKELHNVCRLFELEKTSHNELKQTWKLANENFLKQQQNLIAELELTKLILTPGQREQLSKSNRPDNSKAIKTVAEHPYQVTSAKPVDNKNESNDNLIDFDFTEFSQVKHVPNGTDMRTAKEPVSQNSDILTKEIFSAFFPAAYQAKQFNEMLSDSSSDSDDDDDLEKTIRIQNLKRYALEEGVEAHSSTQDAIFARTNPVAMLEDFDHGVTLKKSTSTDDMVQTSTDLTLLRERSLSQGDISNNTDLLLNLHDKSIAEHSADDSVWNNISGNTHTCMMCQNYEKQLQRLQKDYMTKKEQEQTHLEKINSLQCQLNSEKGKIEALEKGIDTVSSDNKTQLAIYEKNQQEVDKQVLLLQNQFQEFQINILKEVKSLSEN